MFFRLLIGIIGASFVITQYHTTVMFAPNVVGTANATSAGWGNLGGGVTQIVMPLIFSGLVIGFGLTDAQAWRASMLAVGIVIFMVGIAYYFLTQDAPDGNYKELREKGLLPEKKKVTGAYFNALKDYRVWVLFLIYGACFGIELTVNNTAALYFYDYFNVSLVTAGAIAASFGLMNIFARTLGGIFGDNFGALWGLRGRLSKLERAVERHEERIGDGLEHRVFPVRTSCSWPWSSPPSSAESPWMRTPSSGASTSTCPSRGASRRRPRALRGPRRPRALRPPPR